MVEWHVFQNVAAGRRRRARPARQISRRTVCAALGMRRGDLADEINARGNSGAQPAYRAPTSTGYGGASELAHRQTLRVRAFLIAERQSGLLAVDLFLPARRHHVRSSRVCKKIGTHGAVHDIHRRGKERMPLQQ